MSLAPRFTRAVTSPLKHHIYLSRSRNVAVNLSIEHYLLQKSDPESTVLFLYRNKPCIVIGRNQNPWLEVNHALVRHSSVPVGPADYHDVDNKIGKENIRVIRRRSGGGTVFHDLGNVNFSVICPPATFNRDKYAEMVVRAIRRTNPRARVNERHDIVLDPGPALPSSERVDPEDTHRSPFTFGDGPLTPLKVSGSAYKLVRQRALHHGTCLFNSPNISHISEYLRSPARPFMKARGVESVRSPVANICDEEWETPDPCTRMLRWHVIEAFVRMHKLDMTGLPQSLGVPSPSSCFQENWNCAAGVVDDDLLAIPEIASGVEELQSPHYLYNQTPQFTLSSHPCDEDDRPRPPLPAWFPPSARAHLTIKQGTILSSKISLPDSTNPPPRASSPPHSTTCFAAEALEDRNVVDIRSFEEELLRSVAPAGGMEDDAARRVGRWLDVMLGRVD